MKKNKKVITTALVVGFIASTFSTQASAAATENKLVKELSNGFNELQHEVIITEFSKYGVSMQELSDYTIAANHQTPLALGVSGYEFFDNSEDMFVTPNYILGEGVNLENKQKQVDKEVKRVVKSIIKKNMTEKQKHEAIYQYLVEKVKYDQTTFNKYKSGNTKTFSSAHSAYGALVDYVAVCQGITAAYKALADEAGLKSIVVTGTHNGTPHTWNKVMVNGKWANLDATIKNNLVFATDEKAVTLKYKENLDYAPDSEIAAGKYSTSGKPVKIETAIKEVVKEKPAQTTNTKAVYDKSVTAKDANLVWAGKKYPLGYPVNDAECLEKVAPHEYKNKPELTDYQYHLKGYTPPKELAEDIIKQLEKALTDVRGAEYLDTYELRYSITGDTMNVEITKK